MSIQQDYLRAIADAIRFAEGSTGEIPANTFAERIRALTSASPIIQPLSVTSNGVFVVPSDVDGYNPVTVNVPMPEDVERATPQIVLDTSTGLVTATSVQKAGVVSEGTKSANLQLATQPGKTVTPLTVEQIAVSTGKYTTGNVKVAAVETAELATPSILVDNTGMITATVKQLRAGYIVQGSTKSATKQLDVRTASDLEASNETVTVPAGYYAESASKSVATIGQATPGISVAENGKIIASTTQAAGYVSAGKKSAEHQLSNTDDADFIAANIRAGKNVFGVSGTCVPLDEVAHRSEEDISVSGATVSFPDGYYAESQSKSVTTAPHPKPSATIDSMTGVVTATHTQETGYVVGGTTSDTIALTTQDAKTVTPGKSEKTAVSAGVYTTGEIKIAAIPEAAQATPNISVGPNGKITASAIQAEGYVDAGTKTQTHQLSNADDEDFIAANIRSGKNIFGVAGTCVPLDSATPRGADDVYVSGATVSFPAGYYAESQSKSVATVEHSSPTASINSTTGAVTASHTQSSGYVTGGTKTGTLSLPTQAAKTVSPTLSEQTVVAAGKYTIGDVKVAAMPTATQATPSISVSNTGLITASSTQTAGYVSAGTKTQTQQLTTQSARAILPGTIQTVAVEAGIFTTGAVTVAGDANLVPENIMQGVSIFGVAGKHVYDVYDGSVEEVS